MMTKPKIAEPVEPIQESHNLQENFEPTPPIPPPPDKPLEPEPKVALEPKAKQLMEPLPEYEAPPEPL